MLDKRLNIVNGLKLLCAVLGLLLVVQIVGALGGDDSLAGLDPSGLPGAVGATSPGDQEPEPASGKPAAVKLPEIYSPIVERHVFGARPPLAPKPIVLEGIANRTVFFGSPKGRSVLAKVGDTVDGVKVLEIRQNRVLIEHNGEKKELVINEGLGSQPILPPPATKAGGSVKPNPNPKPKDRAPTRPEGQEQKK